MSNLTEGFDYGISIEELRRRFTPLYSGLIYDVLDEMGLPYQALAKEIKPLKDEWVIAGPAYTVKMETTPSSDPSLRAKRLEMLKMMVPGMVEIRDCANDEQVAHFGELNANIVRAKGCVGAVVDGGTRDSRFVMEMDFPVFARYRNPVEALRRAVVTKAMIEITVRGALSTSVLVRPYDYVFADLDGVIIIPREKVKTVLEKAEQEFKHENEARELYRQPGADPVAIYKMLGKL